MFKREKPLLAADPGRTAGPGGEQSAPTSGKRGSANDKNASTIDKNGRGGRARRETEKEAMA